MTDIIKKLRGGDLRSIGRSNEVAQEVEKNPVLFKAVFEGLFDTEPVVRMRSADIIEKVTRSNPLLLSSYTSTVISILANAQQQEVCWHMAQIAPRLKCNESQENEVIESLKRYLLHKSKIVQASAMESLATVAERNNSILDEVVEIITRHKERGSPAVQSRGRKLLKRLEGKSKNLGHQRQ
jgi:hypothetical protein